MSSKQPRQGVSKEPVWDALVGVSNSVASITQLPSLLIPLLENQQLVEKIENRGHFNRLMQTFTSDVTSMSARLRHLGQQHAGRVGPVKSGDDLMLHIQIHQEYLQWAGEYDDLIMPAFREIVEILNAAGANVESINNVQSATALVDANT